MNRTNDRRARQTSDSLELKETSMPSHLTDGTDDHRSAASPFLASISWRRSHASAVSPVLRRLFPDAVVAAASTVQHCIEAKLRSMTAGTHDGEAFQKLLLDVRENTNIPHSGIVGSPDIRLQYLETSTIFDVHLISVKLCLMSKVRLGRPRLFAR